MFFDEPPARIGVATVKFFLDDNGGLLKLCDDNSCREAARRFDKTGV